MLNNDIERSILAAFVSQNGRFTFRKAVSIAFYECPNDYTKQQILKITTVVLNHALDHSLIKAHGYDLYESALCNLPYEEKIF